MIFALHPVHVESVAWITERKNVLMGPFFLLSLLGWCSFIEGPDERRWISYALCLIAYTIALTAKTTACTLPTALFLILWLQKKTITRERIVQVMPYVLLGIGMGLITIWWERYHQGTQGDLFSLGPIERLLVATRAIWFYLAKLFWPTKLTFIYPQWKIDPANPLSYGDWRESLALPWIIWRAGVCPDEASKSHCCFTSRLSLQSWASSCCTPSAIPTWQIITSISPVLAQSPWFPPRSLG